MNKSEALLCICLVVLLFCGCEDASDSSKDQAPTPIEEEQRIQDAPEMVLVDNGESETEQALGTYFVEKKVVFEFGEEEIFNEQELIGQYIEGVPYFDLSKIADRFGWTCSTSDGKSIEKGNLQYQFEEGNVQRIFLGEHGPPYKLKKSLQFEDENWMVSQRDAEALFGLQSWWETESRELTLIEWGWSLPDQIQVESKGDEAVLTLRVQPKAGNQEVLDDSPGIRVMNQKKEQERFDSFFRGEGWLYTLEFRSAVLTPGTAWTGDAWVYFQERPLGIYPLNLEFHGESGEIHIGQTGPWETFALESPELFYTKDQELMTIKGTTEDEWVDFLVEAWQGSEFVTVYDERMEVDQDFEWNWTSMQPGIFRIQVRSGDSTRETNRTRLYYEKVQ